MIITIRFYDLTVNDIAFCQKQFIKAKLHVTRTLFCWKLQHRVSRNFGIALIDAFSQAYLPTFALCSKGGIRHIEKIVFREKSLKHYSEEANFMGSIGEADNEFREKREFLRKISG